MLSLRRALIEGKAKSLAPNDQIDKLLDKLDSCDRVIDLVNDHVAHTANPARSPNVSDSTCPWADLFKAQEAICRVAISLESNILRRKIAINIMPVPLWIVGTPPRKYYIIGYVTDSRPGGPIPMARRNPDMAAQARITTS